MQPIIHKKLRKDKIKQGKCPVVIQIYHNKTRKQIFAGLSIEPTFWDQAKQEATNKHHDYLFFNRCLKNKVEQLEKEFFRQELNGEVVNIKVQNKQSRISFADYAAKYYDGLSNKASKHYIDKCKASIRAFTAFAGDVTFQGVTPQVLKGFEDHLFSLGRQRNTINFNFKKLKQPFTQANKEGVTDYNPFKIFQAVTYKQTKRDYVTVEEVRKLEKVEVLPELEYIRSAFLLSCYTGLRWGDVKNFDKSQSVIVNNGVERIIIGTTKTGEMVSIKLAEKVKRLIDKIDRKLPSNIHCNRLIKAIFKSAGIERHLTWHSSRHAAAVNMLSAGLKIELIARLLGHTNIRTTQIYTKIIDPVMDEGIDRFNDYMG